MDLRKPPRTNRELVMRLIVMFGVVMFPATVVLLVTLGSDGAVRGLFIGAAASFGAALSLYYYQRQ